MSRYDYDEKLVKETLDYLASAEKTLDYTNTEMKKGMETIYNARGAENINVDFSIITNYNSQVIEYIDIMSTEIRSKAQEIEEYNDTHPVVKFFASIGLGALKLVEGLISFVGMIGDGLVSVVGFIGGLFSTEFEESVAEFVKKDYVGDFFADQYENGVLEGLNDASYFSHQSTCANVLKGVGVAVGAIIISVATAGAGTAAVSLAVTAAAATAAGIGSGTQDGLQAGMSFDQAFGQGVKEGVKAGVTTLVLGGVANKLGSLAKGIGGAMDDVGTAVIASTDDVVNAGTKALTVVDDVASAADDVANIGTKALTVADDVASAADDVAGLTDDIAALADDATGMADDALEVVGKKVGKDGREFLKVKDSNGKVDMIDAASGKSAVQGTKYTAEQLKNIGINVGDDIANAGTKALTVADDMAGMADDVAGMADDVGNVADDVANAAKKPGLGKRVANKVDNVVTKFGTETKVGQALSKAAAKAGPKVTNAIAAGAGGSGLAKSSVESAAYNAAVKAEASPKYGQQLYTETSTALQEGIPTTATAGEAAQNLKNMQEQGYNPGSATTTKTQPTTNPASGQSGGSTITAKPAEYNSPQYSSGGSTNSSGGNYTETISGNKVNLPEYSSGTSAPTGSNSQTSNAGQPATNNYAPSNTKPSASTSNSYTGPENNIVGGGNSSALPGPAGGNNVGGTTPNTGTTPSISGVTGNESIKTSVPSNSSSASGNASVVSGSLMEKIGNISDSFSEITSPSKTSIPTSASPILTTENATEKPIIPLGAGLGAAAVAGIGAKAFMDKRDKKDEEETINTEEWEEESDSLNVEYNAPAEEEADYLSPMDEYAFQE